MTQATAQPITFNQFLQQYPEDGGRYELFNGAIASVKLRGCLFRLHKGHSQKVNSV
jgi:hypothetical protein